MKNLIQIVVFGLTALWSTSAFSLSADSQTLIDNYLSTRFTTVVEVSSTMQSTIDFEKFNSTFYIYSPTAKCVVNGVSYDNSLTAAGCMLLRDSYAHFIFAKKNLLNAAITDLELRAILDTILR